MLAQGLGNVRQVARIKGHSHRAAGGLVHAGSGGVTLGNQQHASPGRITAPVPQPRLAPALQKQFVGAFGRALGGNALQVQQITRRIAQGHQQAAIGGKAQAMGLHALAGQVGAGTGVAGCIPLRHRVKRCSRVGRVLVGLVGLLALGFFTGAACQLFGAGCGRGFAGLGQHKAVFFGQVQQGANAHPAACLDAAPGAARGAGFVTVCGGAPCLKQITARVVGKLAFDGHAHPRPIFTRQAGRDVRQGCADQVGGDVGGHLLNGVRAGLRAASREEWRWRQHAGHGWFNTVTSSNTAVSKRSQRSACAAYSAS